MQITEDVIHAVNDAVKEYHPEYASSGFVDLVDLLPDS